MRPEQTAIAVELANQRKREEQEECEEILERELRYGPTYDDPSVEAEHLSTRQKRGKP